MSFPVPVSPFDAVPGPPASALEGVHLLVGFYEAQDPGRARELQLCLALNAANPYVHAIHLLLETRDHSTIDLRRLGKADPP